MESYRLRPHHGMCLHFFEGKGYSDSFTRHMETMQGLLLAQPSPEVQLVNETDSICSACPHNVCGQCDSAQKVRAYDDGVLAALSMHAGDRLTFSCFYQLVKDHVLKTGIGREICSDCFWREICYPEQNPK